MPERRSKQQRWTPGRLKRLGCRHRDRAPCAGLAERLAEKAHAEQVYRLFCLGLLSLSREYPLNHAGQKPVASWPTGKDWCGLKLPAGAD